MSGKYLVVVDMQKDFVTGSLGSADAQKMLPDLIEYVRNFDGQVIFTYDTHHENYMDTQEGSKLPVKHCIKGTQGWELCDGLDELRKSLKAKTFEKPTFPSKDLAMYLAKVNEESPIESITFTGVCTDICVISNALTVKAFLPETPLYMVEALTEATSKEMKAKTLDVARSCQIDII